MIFVTKQHDGVQNVELAREGTGSDGHAVCTGTEEQGEHKQFVFKQYTKRDDSC